MFPAQTIGIKLKTSFLTIIRQQIISSGFLRCLLVDQNDQNDAKSKIKINVFHNHCTLIYVKDRTEDICGITKIPLKV